MHCISANIHRPTVAYLMYIVDTTMSMNRGNRCGDYGEFSKYKMTRTESFLPIYTSRLEKYYIMIFLHLNIFFTIHCVFDIVYCNSEYRSTSLSLGYNHGNIATEESPKPGLPDSIIGPKHALIE